MNAIQQIIGWMPALLQATGVTLALSVTSVLTALVLAVFLALGKISKNTVLRSVCGAYIFFFRGTPLLMQLFFLYYTLPQLVPAFNIQSRFLAAWIAFSLNVAAYLAEIIRAAIQSIDKGQLEASTALGLTHSQAMRLVNVVFILHMVGCRMERIHMKLACILCRIYYNVRKKQTTPHIRAKLFHAHNRLVIE